MSNRTLDSSNLQSALLAKVYSSFVDEIDLKADSGTLLGAGIAGEPCRRIRVTGAGNLACYFAGAPTTKVLLTYAVGDEDEVQLVKIGNAADGTTATGVVVYW
jgi:hypothetical protein